MRHRPKAPAPVPADAVIEDLAAPVPPARSRGTFWTVRRVRSWSVGVTLAACGVALLASWFGLRYVHQTEQRLAQLEEYVQGKGEQRDRQRVQEQRERQEQIRAAICDLLDQLPEGGLLDGPRQRYGCGPGVPLASYPPEVRQRVQQGRPSTPTTPVGERAAGPTQADRSSERPDLPASPTPTPAPPPPAGASAAAPPSPPPAPAPPSPLLDLVCDTTSICLEAP